MTLKFRTYAEAWAVNERVTADCIRNNQWTDGITTNSATPTENESGQWEIPILPGYEQYFTLAEISRAQRPDWFDVPTWRIRAILAVMGLEDTVTAAIGQLPEPQQTFASRAWNNGSTTERNSGTVVFIQQVLQLTDDQVDNIFIQAKNIEV